MDNNKEAPFLDDTILFSTAQKPTNLSQFMNSNYSNGENINFNVSTPQSQKDNEKPQNFDMVQNIFELMRHCNTTLENYGYSKLGVISENDNLVEYKKTLMTIFELLQQRQSDLEFRTNVQENMAKTETDSQMLRDINERLNEEIKEYKKMIGYHENRFNVFQKEIQRDITQLHNQNQDLQKVIANFSGKEKQFLNDIRKKEQEFNKTKDKIKMLSNKTLQNQNFQQKCFLKKNFSNSDENQEIQYFKMICTNFEKENKQFREENEIMRNIIYSTFNELNASIYYQKNQFLIKQSPVAQVQKELNKTLFQERELIDIQKDILNMPMNKVNTKILDIFHKNLATFGFYMSKMMKIPEKPPEPKKINFMEIYQQNLKQSQQTPRKFLNESNLENLLSQVDDEYDKLKSFEHAPDKSMETVIRLKTEPDMESQFENLNIQRQKSQRSQISQLSLQQILEKKQEQADDDYNKMGNKNKLPPFLKKQNISQQENMDQNFQQQQQQQQQQLTAIQSARQQNDSPSKRKLKPWEIGLHKRGQSQNYFSEATNSEEKQGKMIIKYQIHINYNAKSELSLSIVSKISMKDITDVDENELMMRESQIAERYKVQANELKKWHLTFSQSNLHQSQKKLDTVDIDNIDKNNPQQ